MLADILRHYAVPNETDNFQVYLAMEQKESSAAAKAARLLSEFEKSFLHIGATFHPSGLVGEIAGKSSNVAFAARHILEAHRTALRAEPCNVLVTVMDGKCIHRCHSDAQIESVSNTFGVRS